MAAETAAVVVVTPKLNPPPTVVVADEVVAAVVDEGCDVREKPDVGCNPYDGARNIFFTL